VTTETMEALLLVATIGLLALVTVLGLIARPRVKNAPLEVLRPGDAWAAKGRRR